MLGQFHDNRCYLCPRGEDFNNWQEHRQHIKERHGNIVRFVCGICKESFPRAVDRKNHREKEHKDWTFTYENTASHLEDLLEVAYGVSDPLITVMGSFGSWKKCNKKKVVGLIQCD